MNEMDKVLLIGGVLLGLSVAIQIIVVVFL